MGVDRHVYDVDPYSQYLVFSPLLPEHLFCVRGGPWVSIVLDGPCCTRYSDLFRSYESW